MTFPATKPRRGRWVVALTLACGLLASIGYSSLPVQSAPAAAKAALTTTCTTYRQESPLVIPDNGAPAWQPSYISANQPGIASAITVTTWISHTNPEDLSLTLCAPDGTGCTLLAADLDTTDLADVPITWSSDPTAGSFAAIYAATPAWSGSYPASNNTYGGMTQFLNHLVTGTWRLLAQDAAADHSGQITAWELTLCTTDGTPEPTVAPQATWTIPYGCTKRQFVSGGSQTLGDPCDCSGPAYVPLPDSDAGLGSGNGDSGTRGWLCAPGCAALNARVSARSYAAANIKYFGIFGGASCGISFYDATPGPSESSACVSGDCTGWSVCTQNVCEDTQDATITDFLGGPGSYFSIGAGSENSLDCSQDVAWGWEYTVTWGECITSDAPPPSICASLPTVAPTATPLRWQGDCGEIWRCANWTDPNSNCGFVTPEPVASRTPDTRPTSTPIPTRTPAPYTPQAQGTPGLVIVRQFSTTLTPKPGQAYTHYDRDWNLAQASVGDPPSWSAVKTRVAYAASQGLGTWVSVNPGECAWGARPDEPSVPVGVATITYTAGACGTEYAVDYSDPTFRSEYAAAVADFGTQVCSLPDVDGVALQLGCSGETVNVYNQSASGVTCPNQVELEKQVTCAEYLDWVYQALDQWVAACPTKHLTLATGLSACSSKSDWQAIRDIMTYAAARGVWYRYNGLSWDDTRAYRPTEAAPYPYGRLQYGAVVGTGAAFEPQYAAVNIPTRVVEGAAADQLYLAMAAGADRVFLQSDWFDVLPVTDRDVITATIGTDATNAPAVWLRFRDRIYGLAGQPGYTYTGWPGPFTHLTALTGVATPTQYCSLAVQQTAVAYAPYTPVPCPGLLATPAAYQSNNVLYYGDNAVIGIDVADSWQYAYGGTTDADYTLKLTYLDRGTDTFTVVWRDNTGEVSATITKANTQTWQTATITLNGARLNNGLPTGADIEIRTGTGGEYLYLFWLAFDADEAGRSFRPWALVTGAAGAAATYLLARRRRTR